MNSNPHRQIREENDQRGRGALLNRQDCDIIIKGEFEKSDVHGEHRTCPAAVQEG